MTISGYEWTLLVTALSLSASLAVAGIAGALVARLSTLGIARIFAVRSAPMVPGAGAA